MNQLEEYKEGKPQIFQVPEEHKKERKMDAYIDGYEAGHAAGFDAVVALNLPVRYARWKDLTFKGFNNSKKQPEQWKKMQRIFDKIGNSFNEEALYQYWLDNEFKID